MLFMWSVSILSLQMMPCPKLQSCFLSMLLLFLLHLKNMAQEWQNAAAAKMPEAREWQTPFLALSGDYRERQMQPGPLLSFRLLPSHQLLQWQGLGQGTKWLIMHSFAGMIFSNSHPKQSQVLCMWISLPTWWNSGQDLFHCVCIHSGPFLLLNLYLCSYLVRI